MDYEKKTEQELIRELVKVKLDKFEKSYGPLNIEEEKKSTRKTIALLIVLSLLMLILLFVFPIGAIVGIYFIGKKIAKLRKTMGTVNWIAKEAEEAPNANLDRIIANHYGQRVPDGGPLRECNNYWTEVFAQMPEDIFSYHSILQDEEDEGAYSIASLGTGTAEWRDVLNSYDETAAKKKEKKTSGRIMYLIIGMMVIWPVISIFGMSGILFGNSSLFKVASVFLMKHDGNSSDTPAGGTTGVIQYEENETGYTLVSYGVQDEENVVIPSSYQGKSVTRIAAKAFQNNQGVRFVSIPPSVTRIGAETFRDCTNLENVKLPPYITEIHANSFEGCSSLKEIVIPNGVTRIAAHSFYGCSQLEYAEIPSTVTEIGSSAFRRCYNLREIKIPTGADVNDRAFKESPTVVEYMEE